MLNRDPLLSLGKKKNFFFLFDRLIHKTCLSNHAAHDDSIQTWFCKQLQSQDSHCAHVFYWPLRKCKLLTRNSPDVEGIGNHEKTISAQRTFVPSTCGICGSGESHMDCRKSAHSSPPFNKWRVYSFLVLVHFHIHSCTHVIRHLRQ